MIGKLTIGEWRRAKNISQVEMADTLGVHVNTYRAMENNPMKIRFNTLVAICKILGVKVSDVNMNAGEGE